MSSPSSSQHQRAVAVAPAVKPKCTLCKKAASGAGGAASSSSSTPKKIPDATVACLTLSAYLCQSCDSKAPKTHVRYPISSLKSYIDFDTPLKAGESHARSHPGSGGKFENLSYAGCNTPYHTFWRSVGQFSSAPCLGARTLGGDGKVGPYVFESYKRVGERVLNLAAALRAFGIEPKSRVGLYSVNRPEWVIGEQACYANNLITVPLYDTLGPDAAEHIISQATLSAVICSADKVSSLIEISAKHSNLVLVIVMPQQAFESKPAAVKPPKVEKPAHLRIVNLLEAEAAGAKLNAAKPFVPIVPTPQDYCTFCYTSGTTGTPKGAMITHQNLLNDMASVVGHGEMEIISVGDWHISYLPLAHAFERLTMSNMLALGGATGFSRGNALLLLEDIEELKPTTFAGVPRLYNRLYDKVLAMVNSSSPVKRWLFHTAYNQKLANLRATGTVTHPVWDRLVFGKVAARLGGRVRLMVTGSAPIADNVLQFLRICFSAHVCEGYGQTEGTAASTVTIPGDDRAFGNVGLPLRSNLIKLVDVPEMQYTSKDIVNGQPCPRGEVCFKGTNVFPGYYQDAEKTKEAIDEDGWLHSGDIGMWLPDQTLKLIDRKKNIFKTAQGEYIAPEKIENVYQRCKYIAQSLVHGDSLESHLVGVIVPDEEELTAWAKKNNISYKNFAELVAHPQVKPLILAEMAQVGKEAQLKGFEVVKAIHLTPELFSVENDLLTPTFKLKRNVAAKKFEKEIKAMYGAAPQQPAQIQSKL